MATPQMLEFMCELRKVYDPLWYYELLLCLYVFTLGRLDNIVKLQVITVGVVGGSDLSKITEQLGTTGISACCFGILD